MRDKLSVLHDWDHAYPDSIEAQRKYLDTLISLDNLSGVTPVLGIKNTIYDLYPDLDQELREKFGQIDIRVHVHVIEDFKIPQRRRLWIPPLTQTKATWRYDSDWSRHGRLTLLKAGELPVFHVDYPNYLGSYIEWLDAVLNRSMKIYEGS